MDVSYITTTVERVEGTQILDLRRFGSNMMMILELYFLEINLDKYPKSLRVETKKKLIKEERSNVSDKCVPLKKHCIFGCDNNEFYATSLRNRPFCVLKTDIFSPPPPFCKNPRK